MNNPQLTASQIAVLTKIQRCVWNRTIDHVKFPVCLVSENWDWYIIYLALQDKGIIKKNPQRPAFTSFIQMLKAAAIPFCLTELPSVRVLNHAKKQITNSTYPFSVKYTANNMLPRWRVLYQYLTKLLDETQDA